nr:MAG: hypothetical protein DIU64_10990 [Caldicoprobacter oshimai]
MYCRQLCFIMLLLSVQFLVVLRFLLFCGWTGNEGFIKALAPPGHQAFPGHLRVRLLYTIFSQNTITASIKWSIISCSSKIISANIKMYDPISAILIRNVELDGIGTGRKVQRLTR